MRTQLQTTVLLCIVVGTVSAPRAAGQKVAQTALYFGADIQEFDVIYTTPASMPGNAHLLFLGEPNDVRLQIANRSNTPVSISLDDLSPTTAFQVFVRAMPEGGTAPSLIVQPDIELTGRGPIERVPWQSRIELQGHQTALWHATLRFSGPIQSGGYRLQILPRITGVDGLIEPYQTLVSFELRTATRQDDVVEVARRRLMHAHFAYTFGNPADGSHAVRMVETAAQSVLRLYPNCSDAYEVLGLVAQKEGHRAQAKAFFQRALDLVDSGQDILLTAHQDRLVIEKRQNRYRDDVRAVD
jgi:hypothetical protein